MGDVYRAVNEDVGRAVAIKVLRAEHATNAPMVERFMREARAANLVRHPNVVDVLDIGRDADGSPFIVQELLKGQDLAKYVEKRGGKLSLAEIDEYILPVVDAVAEAHAQGVVHRDIKPENVFLAEQGKGRVPKLLDFGISKIRLPDIRATEVGVMMGTPAYMAPEQVQGSRDADPSSDVWALGVMLFELLAGRLPFEATDAPMLFVAIATKDAPRLIDVAPEVPPSISQITERCLRRAPTERYPSAMELARDFRHALDGTELEPTQRQSVRPAALVPPRPPLEIPDLILPSKPSGGAIPKPSGDATPGNSAKPEREKREAELAATMPLGNVDRAVPASKPLDARSPGNSRSAEGAPLRVVGARAPNSPPIAPAPSKQPVPAVSANVPSGLPGVVLAPGAPASSQRRPALNVQGTFLPEAPIRPTQDLSFLVGVAIVGLSSIGVTAALMTFAHQPDGWPLLQLITKPTPMLSILVQGGLGIVGLVLAGRHAIEGVNKWRGAAGRASAIVSAALAGGFFFVAIELARAAW
jgi:serine/threonine-protein kinase